MERSPEPLREIALIALKGSEAFPTSALVEIIEHAFEQLCWRHSPPELEKLLAGLNAKLTEDA